MGTKGREIITVNIEKLIKMLNKALADEWLATYQYWIGAYIVVGTERTAVETEFLAHAKEEQGHADQIIERIIQLGGTPVLSPKEWFDLSPSGFRKPKKFDVKSLLKQNIDSERDAISDYQKILEFVQNKDHVTHQIASNILHDEVQHEDELEMLLEDIGKK